MSRKIVAISGGENGRLSSSGVKYPYELADQDKEIIRLTSRKHPHFLLMAHALPLEWQEGYFLTMKNIYHGIYGCECRELRSDSLSNSEYVRSLIDWADIIYEGGGNTAYMLELWRKKGFDRILEDAWRRDKVLCGVSAGAGCWFKKCFSDSINCMIDGLGFIDGCFTPHCDVVGRLDVVKAILKGTNQAGILLSNCAALAVVDDSYRLITSDASRYEIEAYGLTSRWKNDQYVVEEIRRSLDYRPLTELKLAG